MKKTILFLALAAFSSNAFSFTQCDRPIENIYNNMNNSNPASDFVFLSFSDGGGTISKSTSQVSEAQLARFFTMALTAQTTGKKLRVRYPEDNISCPPPSGNRNDFLGVWLLDD